MFWLSLNIFTIREKKQKNDENRPARSVSVSQSENTNHEIMLIYLRRRLLP